MIEEKENNDVIEEIPPQQEDSDITGPGPEFNDVPPEQPAPEEKKKKSKLRSTIEWIFTGLFAALFIAFGVGQIDGMIHKNEHYGQMVRLGTSTFVVWTDSMEPIYPVNTALINYLDSEEAIVNRFNASKSDLYYLDDEKPYFNGHDWEAYPYTAQEAAAGYKYIYYNNSVTNWSNPHLVSYCLTDTTIWPGIEMEKVQEHIYRLAIKTDFDRVVFTNGDFIDISFFHSDRYYDVAFPNSTVRPMNPLYTNSIDSEIWPTGNIMTHRIVEIKNTDGINYFLTAGINPSSERFGDKRQFQICTYNKIIGVVKVSSPFIGKIFDVISSAWGLLLFLLIPALYLAVTSIIDILKTLKENENGGEDASSSGGNSSPRVESLDNLSNADRERLKKEMLDEMINKKKDKDK